MRYLIILVVLCMTSPSFANDMDGLIEDLKSRDISLQTIAALAALDQPDLKVGYGLCEAAGQPFCKVDGSLGYGLCEVADGALCKEDGSLGYGLCMLGGNRNCKQNGSLGYGLCMLAGEKNCKP